MNRESLNPTEYLIAEDVKSYRSERSFKDLRVWQMSVELAVACYKASEAFPPKEAYGLSSQLRRSAVSVSSNIAEGYGRNGTKEFARFLDIALGSVSEVQSLLEIAVRVGYLASETASELNEMADHTARSLFKFKNSLRR